MSAVPGILVVLLALLGLALGSVLFAPPALAHPAPFGVPGFFGGLLHPAFVPAHLMAALGLGILVGQQAPHWWACLPFSTATPMAPNFPRVPMRWPIRPAS